MNSVPMSPTETGRALAEAAGLGGALLWSLAQHNGWGLAVKSAVDGRYLAVNPAMAQLLGRGEAEILGRQDAELLDPMLATLLRAADQTVAAQGGTLVSDHRLEWRGERREFQVTRCHGIEDGQARLWLLWQDLAPQRQREQQLRSALEQLEQQQRANEALRREVGDQTLRDQTSGLNTRAHFEDQMRRELDLSSREHREFALVYMVIDPLPGAVAALGQAALDRIHEAMGRLLRGNTRAMDTACRIDEQHFAVLLSGVGLATAHSRMEGLRRQCATQIVMLDGQELGFTVSMGVASYPHTAHGHDELIGSCTQALAEARRRGGNNVALASIRFDTH